MITAIRALGTKDFPETSGTSEYGKTCPIAEKQATGSKGMKKKKNRKPGTYADEQTRRKHYKTESAVTTP